MMKLLTFIADKAMRVMATGKIPKVGALFRCHVKHSGSFFIRDEPVFSSKGERVSLFNRDKASFLILEVQKDVPLWNQWVKVLFARFDPTQPHRDETVIGWVDYLDFASLAVASWESLETKELEDGLAFAMKVGNFSILEDLFRDTFKKPK